MSRGNHYRRLCVEQLEERRVLSAAATPGVGININNLNDYSPDLLFANAMMTSRQWGSPATPWDEAATTDAQGWPTEDAGTVVTDPTGGDVGGTYALSFNGLAASVTGVGTNLTVKNQSYNAATNTTTATLVVPAGQGQLILSFTGTQRNSSAALDTGITNVQLMRPTVTDGSTPYSAGTLFTTGIENLINDFSVIRYMDYENTNNNTQVNWSDRTLPSAATQQTANGGSWEYAVALANATNKDMWIDIPEGATPAYVTDLADLIKYGSDGVNPYTSPQANPVYAPLNPNLHVYFEYSNEVWNSTFQQESENENAAVAEVAAGNSPLNYDGTTDPYTLAIRRIVEQTVNDSNIFRSVFGNAGMMTEVRPVYEWQYNNLSDTAEEGMDFLNDYYNNADGQQHVANPEPPNYYLWGGGGAWYYTVNNATGDGDVTVPNYSFETPVSATTQADPTGAGWNFTGTAGIAPNNSTLGNPAASDGTQAAYLQGTGSFSQSVTFSGGYADVSFSAADSTVGTASTPGTESFEVLYDGTPIGPASYQTFFQPASNSYVTNLTMPFETTAGAHTITFVGLGGTGTSFIDNVQVQTVNAMYNSGIQSDSSLVSTEAQWAAAYGLQMTSYEGGFHVGGDSPTPLQTIANLDPRAQAAETSGIDSFFQDGGGLAVFYDSTNLSYEVTDSTDDLNTPKLLAITAATKAGLPAPTIGATLPATAGQSITIPEVSASDYAPGRTTNASIFMVQTTAPGTFTIQVQGSQQSPSTTEHFMVDGQVVPTAVSLASGTTTAVTFTIPSAGLHAISLLSDGTSEVFVNGNMTIKNVTSSSGTSASTTSLAASVNPAKVGQAVTFTATVAAVNSGAGTPTGTVTFKDGSTVLGTGTLSVVNGVDQATFTTSSLAVGSHSITAVYGGNSTFTTSTSAAIAQVIGQAATTTSVASSANPSTFGQSITLTAAVKVVSPGAGTPTGTVTFKDGSTVLGTGTLSVVNGVDQATFTTSSLATGSHSITAVYGGSSSFTASTSTALSQVIAQGAATTTSVTSSVNPTTYGQSMVFTAIVKAVTAGAGTPTGNVTFYDGTSALGTGALSVVNGVDQATFSTSSLAALAAGSHSITAVYGGDTKFTTSTSGALTQTIGEATPSVTVTDNGGTYSGAAFPATDTVNGGSSLEGVTPSLTYYAGSSATGTALSGAPSAVGTYTVVANFAGSADYTSANKSTTFMISSVTIGSGLLAYEGFGGAAGPLEGAADGTGWNASSSAGAVGWYVQNLSTATPGFQVNAAGLTYPNLQTSAGSASGGTSYLTAGRRLDTTTAFAPYDVSGTQQIGAAGTTLWFSALVDRQTPVGAGQTPTSIDFSNNSVEWSDANPQFGIGYYGASSDSGGVGYWSLLVGGTVLQSTVPISVGQTSLLVLQMNFSSTGDTFSLYVNPTSLGSSAPTTPSAQLTGSNITFSSLVYNAGYTTQVSTIDELRMGQSFAAVTPTTTGGGGGGSKTTPTVTVTDNSGPFTDAPFVATDTVNGVSNLEGVTPSLSYYAGSSATGTPLGGPPTAVGTYMVVASFPGSADYTSASASRTFTISKATPSVSVADGGGMYSGAAFPATDTVSGVGSESTPAASLEGVTPSLTYYSGTSATGTALSGAPTAIGTYTVLASFAGSTDYTSASSSATFSISSSITTGSGLLAYEGFGGAAGPLEGEADGTGWNTSTTAGAVGWYVQNLNTATPGFQVNAAGLTYPNLQTSAGSASGGTSYLTAGRRLDTTTAFAPYDVSGTQQIGAAGTTLWFSVLVDRQTPVGAGQTPTSVDFSNNSVEWNDNSRQFGVGYYGASSDSGGVGYWSLLVGGTVLRSNVPIGVGQTSLLVLQMNFSITGDTFSLYVNPTSLGSSTPTTPSAQLTGSNITFSSVVYNAGYTTQVSTIDELRMGQSFAAVTPTTSCSSQAVSNSVVVAPAATTTTINFENFAASSAALAEPLVINGFAFTSSGTSAGHGLMIEGPNSTPTPGLWPSNVLMTSSAGTTVNIAPSGDGTFSLNSLQVESNGQARSAVITGYSATGAVLDQQIVNFTAAGYSAVTANLGWVGVSKVSVSWWQNSNGTGGTRFGAVDNLSLSTG